MSRYSHEHPEDYTEQAAYDRGDDYGDGPDTDRLTYYQALERIATIIRERSLDADADAADMLDLIDEILLRAYDD